MVSHCSFNSYSLITEVERFFHLFICHLFSLFHEFLIIVSLVETNEIKVIFCVCCFLNKIWKYSKKQVVCISILADFGFIFWVKYLFIYTIYLYSICFQIAFESLESNFTVNFIASLFNHKVTFLHLFISQNTDIYSSLLQSFNLPSNCSVETMATSQWYLRNEKKKKKLRNHHLRGDISGWSK